MKAIRALAAGLALAFTLSGCGTMSGAVLGGYAGHKIGGDTMSTVGGAVVGGMIGHEISK